MSRPKKLEDIVRLSVVLPKALAESLKKEALRRSVKEGRQITVSETIRSLIETGLPVKKTRD